MVIYSSIGYCADLLERARDGSTHGRSGGLSMRCERNHAANTQIGGNFANGTRA